MYGKTLIAVAMMLAAQEAYAADTYTVAPRVVADEKAVFATVETANVTLARARIGGTVAQLSVKEGDHVEQGQLVATVGDEKLALQMHSLDAQIQGLEAQRRRRAAECRARLQPELAEDGRGRAEAGESRLQHVQPDESRQEQPVGADEMCQHEAEQNHGAGDGEDRAIDIH